MITITIALEDEIAQLLEQATTQRRSSPEEVITIALKHYWGEIIDEDAARRKANRWLVEYVGNMMMADQAHLSQSGGRTVWRFGAYITAPSHPPVGPIGYVDVEAATGSILTDLTQAQEMLTYGQPVTAPLLSSAS
jgi:hypothetical protein